MHGTGNDFLIVQPDFFGMSNIRQNCNTFSQEERDFMKSTVINLCKFHFGVGADGILIISQV
jgi:diaminopimelate epimerase